MTLAVTAQLAGIAFACGLNLYLTIAALGALARFGLLQGLAPGLQGLQGTIVIATALVLFLVEAVIDRTPHLDSIWDIVHTFIRPPAAALLAVGALWGEPVRLTVLGAALAFILALVAHGTKAGLRMSLNATMSSRWQQWISLAEDALAVALAVAAVLAPVPTLAALTLALLLCALLGPRLWRAFLLGNRCVTAWLRSVVAARDWRTADELPGDVRQVLGTTPVGGAPPRAARAALDGLPEVGAFRNGWLVRTAGRNVFVFRTLLGTRRVELPEPVEIDRDPGVWTDLLRVRTDDGSFTLFLLKDGPDSDRVSETLDLVTI